jgi:hypothetical protein
MAALLPVVAAAPATGMEIQHNPIPCVAADRFARVAAKASPAARTAELRFRSDPDGPWYAVAMKPENGEWSAVLPRPMAPLTRFEYTIAMTGEGREASETPAHAVSVAADPSACSAADLSSVSSSIVVRVPPGVPVVPPVPRGFDPTGVVAAEMPAPAQTKKVLLIGGALAAAGGLAAVAGGGSSEAGPPGPDTIPGFVFESIIPAPGSTISLSRDTVQVLVRMDREPPTPLRLDWAVEWRQAGFGTLCATMGDTFNGAQRPTGLVLTAPLVPRSCGTSFDTSLARITLRATDQVVFDVITQLPYHFEP